MQKKRHLRPAQPNGHRAGLHAQYIEQPGKPGWKDQNFMFYLT